jgi:hypothetical protein
LIKTISKRANTTAAKPFDFTGIEIRASEKMMTETKNENPVGRISDVNRIRKMANA